MVEFKPIEYGFNKVGYNQANKEAKEKLEILDEMLVWCANKEIFIKSKKDMQMFAISPVNHFKHLWYEKNSKKIELPINVDKLLDLMDINIFELQQLAIKYEKNRAELGIVDDKKTKLFKYAIQVDRNKFCQYTTSAEQNKKLKALQKFIKEVKAIEKIVGKVYPYDICNALGRGQHLGYDISSSEFKINL